MPATEGEGRGAAATNNLLSHVIRQSRFRVGGGGGGRIAPLPSSLLPTRMIVNPYPASTEPDSSKLRNKFIRKLLILIENNDSLF